MITLILLPNFKGTEKQFYKALTITLFIDGFILLGAWASLG